MPMIPVRSSCSLSNVRTATSSASVESSPPEMPTTAFSQRVCTSRLASPCDCIWKISSQRWLRCASSCGTNGIGSISRSSAAARSPSGISISITVFSAAPSFTRNEVFLRRSNSSRSMSRSATTNCSSSTKRFASRRIFPFSAMMPFPANTRSVDDSPKPAEQ